jgi:hypothetical protein
MRDRSVGRGGGAHRPAERSHLGPCRGPRGPLWTPRSHVTMMK